MAILIDNISKIEDYHNLDNPINISINSTRINNKIKWNEQFFELKKLILVFKKDKFFNLDIK